MNIPEPFASWLPDVVQDNVTIPPHCKDEAQANLWTFSLSHEQAARISTAEVVAFVEAVMHARNLFVQSHTYPPMVFYCWHDEHASQLRFSMVLKSYGRLPFGCKTEVVASLDSIAQSFLRDPYHDGIPMSELTDVTHLAEEERKKLDKELEQLEEHRPPLKVWVRELPFHDLPAV